MRILFAIVDGGGNIPPQLAVARALRSRGAEVHFLGHEGVRDLVEAAGFPFDALRTAPPFDSTRRQPLLLLMGDFARTAMARAVGDEVVAAARSRDTDVVVVDMILTGAIAAITASGLPTVVFVHCFYRAVQDLAAGPVGLLLRLRGIPPLGAERSGALQIVSARKDLDPMRGSPPVRHVGVVWQGTPTAAQPATRPQVLVSLSTCAFAGQRNMLQRILDALAPLDVSATVTVGPGIDAEGLRVPPNATMHAWLDHDRVLATASLVIGHGGHSTAMRALSFGVPMVVLPANTLIDQKGVGKAIQNAGAGLLLHKHSAASRIRDAARTVLEKPQYREAAARLGEQIRQCDGAEVAAEAIWEFAGARVR